MIEVKVTPYLLERVKIAGPLGMWCRKPLPIGSQHLSVNQDVLMRSHVAIDIQKTIKRIAGDAAKPGVLRQLGILVKVVIEKAITDGTATLDKSAWVEEADDYILRAQPEYFEGA